MNLNLQRDKMLRLKMLILSTSFLFQNYFFAATRLTFNSELLETQERLDSIKKKQCFKKFRTNDKAVIVCLSYNIDIFSSLWSLKNPKVIWKYLEHGKYISHCTLSQITVTFCFKHTAWKLTKYDPVYLRIGTLHFQIW